ncbi:Putative Thioredoxin-like superfamily [Septoria linicola]|uniref:Thioredoxin-like superfamily n=1 Tax=Septoria linicola TaxID=215465 RepID=A0A9Q9AHI1_9PEZI|nr:Putative Thioredoxin-like superfamily [Septoria linicola]
MRSLTLLSGSVRSRVVVSHARQFATSPIHAARNRIYPTRIRNEDELHTLILSSASSRVPLITLWMTTWSRDCDEVLPIIRELIEQDGVGEDKGSVGFVEVEMDSPDLGGVAGIPQRYMITSVPTLLAFDRQEPQIETKVARLDDLKSREFLKTWIETEAARHGSGGAGGRFFGLFGR